MHVDRINSLPQRRKLIPTFAIDHQNFYLNGRPLSLKRKPLTARLLGAFLQAPGRPQSKTALMEVIYGSFNPQEKSERFQKILKHNLNKLVSRTRLQLDEGFNLSEKWIDFLVYDAGVDGWGLYRLRNGYIALHAQALRTIEPARGAERQEGDVLPRDTVDKIAG